MKRKLFTINFGVGGLFLLAVDVDASGAVDAGDPETEEGRHEHDGADEVLLELGLLAVRLLAVCGRERVGAVGDGRAVGRVCVVEVAG